jgi:hypothetical protein
LAADLRVLLVFVLLRVAIVLASFTFPLAAHRPARWKQSIHFREALPLGEGPPL